MFYVFHGVLDRQCRVSHKNCTSNFKLRSIWRCKALSSWAMHSIFDIVYLFEACVYLCAYLVCALHYGQLTHVLLFFVYKTTSVLHRFRRTQRGAPLRGGSDPRRSSGVSSARCWLRRRRSASRLILVLISKLPD